MRFKIDENLPARVANLLRQHGHDALTVIDQNLGGYPDPDVAHVCQVEHRALITLDLDFANIYRYPPANYFGIVILRPPVQTTPVFLSLMTSVISLLDQEPLDKHLWVVDERRVRIRGASPQNNP